MSGKSWCATGAAENEVEGTPVQISPWLVCPTGLCKKCNSIICPFTQAKEPFIKADLCASKVLPWGKPSVLCFGLPMSVAARGG